MMLVPKLKERAYCPFRNVYLMSKIFKGHFTGSVRHCECNHHEFNRVTQRISFVV